MTGSRGSLGRRGAPSWIAALAILAVNALTWGRTVGHDFVFDDYVNILQNPWIRSFKALPSAFAHHAAGFSPDFSTSFYRPLMHVLYALTYSAAGPRPWAFHALNLAFATACAYAVYRLAAVLQARYAGDAGGRFMPLVAALVFSVHPVHTEAVAWIAGITDLSYTLFGLAALTAYVRGIDRGPRFWPGALLFLSLLSKETGAAILGLFLVLEWNEAQRTPGWSLRAAGARLLPSFTFAAAYVGLRFWALGGFAPSAVQHPHPASELVPAAAGLFARYLLLLIAPLQMNPLRDIPLDRGLADPAAVIGFALAAALLALAVVARRAPFVTLSLGVLVLPLLPALYVPAIESGRSVFGERYLFLPVLAVAWGVCGLVALCRTRRPALRPAAVALTAALLAGGAAVSASRAGVWADSVTLWTDVVEKAPRMAAAQESLCHALMLARRPTEALAACDRALALDPGRVDARTNRASLLLWLGRVPEAEQDLLAVLRVRGHSAEALTLLGLAQMALGQPDQAIASYGRAIAINPGFAEAHNNLGVALARTGRTRDARGAFERAVQLAPENPEYRANLEACPR